MSAYRTPSPPPRRPNAYDDYGRRHAIAARRRDAIRAWAYAFATFIVIGLALVGAGTLLAVAAR